MFFVTDTVQERSDGVDFKATMSQTLTSNAAVCAFFSGTIISSLQASSPGDFTSWSLLYQWYGLFLSMALYFAVNSVLMSCLGMRYLAPLKGHAAESFIATNALYFGEPMCGTMYALVLLLNAKALWVWGLFGWECGCVSIFAIFFMLVRFLVTLQNLSEWENEDVEQDERSRRVMVVDRGGKTSSIGA
uniref:Uncharacterized protein n=1 Tax=Florenciella parvula TaxID=236787 RepID=A0A7S2C1Q0_9STRA|mmetsp:Transcript_23480/g.48612  ORF Transcript_23480/g.48612 Transcript_23480/m.48612 type:complete len:189 (+) Transcript_23480:3-569(+)